jgi:hypothetical protein
MTHPNGGPGLALRPDPDLASKAAGFDYFSIGVPTRAALEELAGRLTELGDEHGGVRLGSTGWVLPYLHDPDGHEVRFYTTEQHTDSNDPSIRVLTEAHGWANQREYDVGRPTPGAQ